MFRCRRLAPLWLFCWTVALCGPALPLRGEPVPETDQGQYDAPRRTPPALPKQFAFVFSLPYGQGDEFPRDPKEFERMLVLLRKAGFNTVHCTYTDWRHDLFRKHGMQMMVDVLAWKPPAETDIRRNDVQRGRVRDICRKCRGSEAIWGYNLWNERLDWYGDFKRLDLHLRMLRTWDPTHPVWVGTYRHLFSEHYPTSPGVVAWYDYHWRRGMSWHFAMLQFYEKLARKRRSAMGRWLLISQRNENLYTLNTSIAFGLKTCIWFIGGPYAAREPDKTKRWNEQMHLVEIGRHMQPLYKLIGEMGHPVAVYSTPTRRTPANADKPLGVPDRLPPFPKDFWLQVKQGEVLCGVFDWKPGSQVLWLANHNAYAWQGMVLELDQSGSQHRVVWQFDRAANRWQKLGAQRRVSLPVAPADAVVLRVDRVEADRAPLIEPDQKAAAAYDPRRHFQQAARLLEQQKRLAKGTLPQVYSTPTRRTKDNRDKAAGLPPGIEPVPPEGWFQIKQGEMLAAVFPLQGGEHALCLANHNALAWQGGLVVLPEPNEGPRRMIWVWEPERKRWKPLGRWADLNFALPPGGSVLFRFGTFSDDKP